MAAFALSDSRGVLLNNSILLLSAIMDLEARALSELRSVNALSIYKCSLELMLSIYGVLGHGSYRPPKSAWSRLKNCSKT